MPRATFKPVTTANLARVFVAILAMDPDDIAMIIETFVADKTATIAIREHFTNNREQFGVPTANNLAKLFDAILSTPKEVRKVFVVEFDRVLDEIHQGDGFGTDGQCDPRGDHRN